VTDSEPADKDTWKVASPPPPLPIAVADELLAGWRGTKRVVSAEPLTGGLMNWNYAIRLSGTPERFVMRFYDRAPDACAMEARLLARLGADVPVPRVLHAELRGIGDYPPFCVLEFIDGISLRELRRRGDLTGVAEASYDAGRWLPRLSAHSFERSGRLSPDLDIVDDAFADASLVEVIEYFAAAPLFGQRIEASLLARMRDLARSHGGNCPGAGAGITLVHGDFNSPNIFVRRERGVWRVAAILDWEFALAGSMLCDIGNMLRYERPSKPRYEPAFSRGLIDGGWRAPDDWFLRARLADLPALCELLTRRDLPDAVAIELRDLIEMTCV
jgi:aminoglycoside phosphotransferase (APT) family kinase protein